MSEQLHAGCHAALEAQAVDFRAALRKGSGSGRQPTRWSALSSGICWRRVKRKTYRREMLRRWWPRQTRGRAMTDILLSAGFPADPGHKARSRRSPSPGRPTAGTRIPHSPTRARHLHPCRELGGSR